MQCDSDQVVVSTDKGPVSGLQTATMNEFLGIPYAGSVSGENRWEPPPPAAAWWGTTLQAKAFGPHCPQLAGPFGVASGTEDCLYLNVFTPIYAKGWQNLPVMVWIYGGAFVEGESDTYDPTKLVAEGVVVVTLNYRLGILGFLAHPALGNGGPSPASGNYGFLDQQAALLWVKKNIKNFGGNPDNVTIFGESAGGMSVHVQLASPLAKGLFQRAIIESGAYQLNTVPLATAEGYGEAFATSLSTPCTTAACLRALPLATLLNSPYASAISTVLAPNVDSYVLPDRIGVLLDSGEFNRVPVMEGSNHDEARLFVALEFVLSGALGPVGTQVCSATYPTLIGDLFELAEPNPPPPPLTPPPSPGILGEYPAANYSSYGSAVEYSIALSAVGTDAIFACPSRDSIQMIAQYVPTFAYEFNDENAPELFLPAAGFPYGAAHASELQYIFKITQSLYKVPLNPIQEILSANMIRYWTQFARTGNPNSFLTPFWPQYNLTADQFQSLIPPWPRTESNFAAEHNCAFWVPNIFTVY
jgi:para-nitrobenzyl esterase